METTNVENRYRYVRERDIDLVLCVAASSIPAVARLFRESDTLPAARHSVPDRNGEVDVVLEWPDAEVHVENKVDAEFQPDQPERYERRSSQANVPTTTVLLAPQSYIDSHDREAGVFASTVSYEQLAEALESDGSPVASELAILVRRGVDQHRAGRPANHDDLTTEFFAAFEAQSAERGLPWEATGKTQSAGRGFNTLNNWDHVAGRKVSISAKFNQHNKIDITVSGAGDVVEQAAIAWQAQGVFVRASKSGALLIGRDTVVLHTDVTGRDRSNAIDRVLDVAQAHIQWWRTAGRHQLSALIAAADVAPAE